MTSDPWLRRWLPLVAERAGGLPVLELGCGYGDDTATLLAAGHRVIAIDLSADSIAHAQATAPAAEYHCRDMRAPLPPHDATGLGVAVASLSLHYFPWSETTATVDRIRTALRPRGILLCRLNSTSDHHYGASGHPQIGENFYLVDGQPKRFFDRKSVDELFAKGWRMLAAEELVIHRYAQPKTVWEAVVEREQF